MSRRVAIRNNGDSVEKFAFLAPLATGALAAGKAALASNVGRMAVGGLAFGAGKRMATNAFKDQEKESESFTDKVKSRGEKAADAGAAYAQAQQASHQQMEQRGQQMADKAKAGSQIATGEAMDMSWQMLKAWSFLPGFDAFDKELIISHAKKMKLKHVSIHDLGHHDMRFNQRYKPDQKMPKGAEKLTPRDLSLAYMDLMLHRNPELIERGNQKSIPGGNDEKGVPHPENFPGIVLPLLRTDEPIRSTVKSDKGRIVEQYHPVFAAGHARDEPSEHPKFSLVTANDAATQAGNRKTIKATHTVNRYSHDFYDIADDEARQAYYDEADVPVGVSQIERNRRIIANEANRRHFGNFLQPIDFERMKQQGLGRSMTQTQAEARVDGKNPMADMNPLQMYPKGSPIASQYRQFQASNPPADDGDAGVSAEPKKINRNENYTKQMLDSGLYVIVTDENGNESLVRKGEPIDIAWRMLKSQSLIH